MRFTKALMLKIARNTLSIRRFENSLQQINNHASIVIDFVLSKSCYSAYFKDLTPFL